MFEGIQRVAPVGSYPDLRYLVEMSTGRRFTIDPARQDRAEESVEGGKFVWRRTSRATVRRCASGAPQSERHRTLIAGVGRAVDTVQSFGVERSHTLGDPRLEIRVDLTSESARWPASIARLDQSDLRATDRERR